jgi:hypothetical protein
LRLVLPAGLGRLSGHGGSAEAESDHRLHIAVEGSSGARAGEGLWRISLEAVYGWTLRAAGTGPASGTEDDKGPFAGLLGNS